MNKLAKTILFGVALTLPIRALCSSPWVNRTVVGVDGYQQIAPDVYAAPGLTHDDRERILAQLGMARQRIADLYGAPVARPVTIVAPDDKEARRFGLDDVPGTAFITLLGTQVVLNGKQLSVDVTAHELTHAELAARLGFWARMRRLPVWFDEGVAMQLDWRARYLVDCAAVGPRRIGAVQRLDSSGAFWHGDRAQIVRNYQAAKCAAAQVLDRHPPRTLYASLARLREGGSFDDVFGGAAQ